MSRWKKIGLILGVLVLIFGIAGIFAASNKKSEQQAKSEQAKTAALGESIYKQIQISFEKLPFDKKTVEDNTMPVNTEQVVKKGMDGEQTVTYELIYNQNGDLIEKKVIKSEVTKKAVTEVTKIGTLSQISSTGQVQGVEVEEPNETTPEPEPIPDCGDGFYSTTYNHCVPKNVTGKCAGDKFWTTQTNKEKACATRGGILEWYL